MMRTTTLPRPSLPVWTGRPAWLDLGRLILWVLAVQLSLLSGLCLPASAAQDNAKKQASSRAKVDLSPWQQVTRWEGAFRAVRTYSYDFQSPMAHDTNDYRWVVSGRVVLDEVKPGDSDHGLRHLGWRGKVSALVSYSARGFVAKSHRMEDRGSGNNTSEAQLDMAANGIYIITLGGITIPHIKVTQSLIDGKTAVQEGTMWHSITEPPVKANLVSMIQPKPGQKAEPSEFKSALRGRLPGNGLVIKGSFVVQGHDEEGYEKKRGKLDVEWLLWPAGEVEAVVKIEDYKNWTPDGNLKNWLAPGNRLKIEAKLKGKGKKPLGKVKAQSFLFELVQVSKEPGVCLNWPEETVPEADQPNDLQFDPRGQSPGAEVTEPDGRALRVPAQGGTTAMAVLSCFDFGAYGQLRVTAKLEGGGEIVAFLEDLPNQFPIRIPYSLGESVIVEWWRKHYGVEHLADDSDQDAIGGSDNPGDGLSVYEEYRGFSVDGDFRWSNPRVKTLFVHSIIANIQPGLELFSLASGVEVLEIKQEEYQGNQKRVVNFNHGSNHVVDQHGLWIGLTEMREEHAGKSAYGPPKYVDMVQLNFRMYRHLGSFLSFDERNTIAHELGHALCVPHHGDGAIWRDVTRKGADGKTTTRKAFVTRRRSEQSGVQDCIMRYNWADYIEKTPGNDSTLLPYGDPEPPGLHFCADKKGTGVNAPPPEPDKCGDAVYGSCLRRITISDVYPNFVPQYKTK